MLELFPFSYVRFNKAKHDPKMTCKSLSVNSNRSDLTVSTSITAFENSMIVSIDLQDLDLEEYEQFSSDMAVFGGLSEGRTYWANNPFLSAIPSTLLWPMSLAVLNESPKFRESSIRL